VSEADDLVAELQKARVDEFVVHTCSLLGSLAYGKLQAGELDQAKLAIEALQALQGVLVDPAAKDVENLVASLQLAFADAVR